MGVGVKGGVLDRAGYASASDIGLVLRKDDQFGERDDVAVFFAGGQEMCAAGGVF